MTLIHFKFAYNGKTHRFAPSLQGDQLFQAVKEYVASLVKEDIYKLYWNDGASTMLLDNEDDFSDMLEFAKEMAKSSTKPPCILLSIGVAEAVAYVGVATNESQETVQKEESSTTESDVYDASSNVVAAPVDNTFDDSDSLDELLVSAEDKQRAEMAELRTLAEETKKGSEKHLTADSFSIKHETYPVEGCEIAMAFKAKFKSDYLLWKKCIVGALHKFGLPESFRNSFQEELDELDYAYYDIIVTLESKDIKRVLEILKPIAKRTHFLNVIVEEKQNKFDHLLPDFFDASNVKEITFNYMSSFEKEKTKADVYNHLFDVVKKINPSKLLHYYRINKKALQETFDFLEKCADVIERLNIDSHHYGKKNVEPLPLSLAQNILSRKCNYLLITDSTTKVTIDQAEVLVKHFEENNMKVSLAISTSERKVDNKIGAYNVKVEDLFCISGKFMIIEHEEMNPKMKDICREDLIMSTIHFKFAYNGKTHRFAPSLQGDQLFQAVKDYVASLVKEETYKLCWNDGESTMLLDNEDDFSDMLEYAKDMSKSSTKPPCINLSVGVNDIVAAEAAAVEPEVEEVRKEETSTDSEASNASNAVVAPVAQTSNDNVSKLEALLDIMDEKHRKEMDELRTLAEGLKTDTEKRLNVESIIIEQSIDSFDGKDVDLNLTFTSPSDYSMWKKCVVAALYKLDLHESSLRDDNMPEMDELDYKYYYLGLSLESKDLKKVLEILRPIANRTNFISVIVNEKHIKYNRLLPDFFCGSTVKSLRFNELAELEERRSKKKAKTVDFILLLDLVQKLKPSEIAYYRTQTTKEMFEFLEKAAGLVEYLTVESNCYGKKKKEDPIPLEFVKHILGRKCKYLTIYDTTTKVALAEAEEMAKYFEENNMKVSLAIPTSEKKVDTKFGAYAVKLANVRDIDRGNRLILIEHDEMDPKMEELEQQQTYY